MHFPFQRRCCQLFTLNAATRTLSTKSPFQHIAVIGGGLMGSGIVQIAAQHGHNVTLVEQSDKLLQNSRRILETSLQRIVKKCDNKDAAKKIISDTLGRISYIVGVQDSSPHWRQADLVIEAITENLEMKQKLFKDLDRLVNQKTIIVSNTSSLSIGEIVQPIKASRGDRVGGLHFFNPVPFMKLVEVVRLPETSKSTETALVTFLKAIDKVPVLCKDTPGFIVNRLLVPYVAQAQLMAERGDATKEDIDIAMKLGAGYLIGPFELSDYVGLDTCKFVMDGWVNRFPNDPVLSAKPKVISKLVAEGKLGRKTGEGFYKYKKED